MKEQLISLETAKLAKEKGFNEPCYAYYSESRDLMDHISAFPGYYNVGEQVDILAAPTQSLLTKWLRETHKTYIQIFLVDEWGYWCYEILTADSAPDRIVASGSKCYPTYEEALEEGLFQALKLIM